MAERGRLVEWDDERGFGFITPLDGGSRVFVHVSEFPRDKRRPAALDLLTYTRGTDDRGRPRASNVRFLTPTRARRSGSTRRAEPAGSPSRAKTAIGASATFLAAVVVLAAVGAVPLGVPLAYLMLSAVLFAVYGLDKSAAQAGGGRIRESTLHLFALLGGWPGALVAQRVFRHKSRKQPFQTVFRGTVIGNCVLLAVLVSAQIASRG